MFKVLSTSLTKIEQLLNGKIMNTDKFKLSDPIQFLALGFGSGLVPKAPGTFGTIAAIPLLLLCSTLTIMQYVLLVCVMAVIGIYICEHAAKAAGVHDHPAIVWDEIVGLFITMFMMLESILLPKL